MPKKKLLTAVGALLIPLSSSLSVNFNQCDIEMSIQKEEWDVEDKDWYVKAHLDDTCDPHKIMCGKVQIDLVGNKIVCEISCNSCEPGNKIIWKDIVNWDRVQFEDPDVTNAPTPEVTDRRLV